LGPSDRGDLSKRWRERRFRCHTGSKREPQRHNDAATVRDFKTGWMSRIRGMANGNVDEDSVQAIAAQVGRSDNDIHSLVAPAPYILMVYIMRAQ